MQRSLEKARTELADLKFLIALSAGGGAKPSSSPRC